MLSMLLKEKRFVVVLQEDYMVERRMMNLLKLVLKTLARSLVRSKYQVEYCYCQEGRHCKINVDAVVNAANEDLKHSGGVALALLQAAGPSLQQTCDQHTKQWASEAWRSYHH